MENNNTNKKLKQYAIYLAILFFVSLLSIAFAYTTINNNDQLKLNEIKTMQIELNDLNNTYQSLNNKKEVLLKNYMEIEKLYLELENSFDKVNQNNNLNNNEIIVIQDKIAYYEAENIKLQDEITIIEVQLK